MSLKTHSTSRICKRCKLSYTLAYNDDEKIKGFCGYECYNAQYDLKEPCACCGALFRKATKRQLYCSASCAKPVGKPGMQNKSQCAYCQASYNTKSVFSPYCTYKCRVAGDKITHTCVGCDTLFIPQSAAQIYCNAACRDATAVIEVNKVSRFKIMERDGFRCFYCGKGSDDGATLHIDHVYPQIKGGGNDIDNLVTCCVRCNSNKSGNLLSDEQIKIIWERNANLNHKHNLDYVSLKAAFDRFYQYR